MSLRSKVLCFVCGVSFTFALTSYLVQQLIVLPGFAQVELSEAGEDVTRCIRAIERDAEFLSSSANDYAAWDDTYQFIEDVNEEYQTENLIPETFKNLKLDLFMFVRNDGTMAWGQIRQNSGEKIVELPGLLDSIAKPDHVLVRHKDANSKIFGLLSTEWGPMLVGSAAITTSNRSGAVRGAVVMGRFVTQEGAEELAERTQVAVQLHPMDAIPPSDRRSLEHLSQTSALWVDESSADVLRGYSLIYGLRQQPALLLRADLPRSISRRGAQAATLAALTSVAGGAVMTLVMWLALSYIIIRPLMRVTSHAVRVGASNDLQTRLNVTVQDEIGMLAREFDKMVEKLAVAQAQMVDMARVAGMSQVATNVLHNVGNVLNTVNVSTNVITDRIRNSEAKTLSVAAEMLDQHKSDLPAFLTQDEQGKQLPAFLAALADQLSSEQGSLLDELKTLTESVEHIRQVVDQQRQHSGHQAPLEVVNPAMVIEQAISLLADSLARHNITIERSIETNEAFPVDRHRALQILVNLLTNAIQAIQSSGLPNRRIRVHVWRDAASEGEPLCVRVEDNGVGIATENIERIFAFGFTTRPDGKGIGLHNAANMAREMGGSLSAQSDGPGQGAAFTLSIPVSVREPVI